LAPITRDRARPLDPRLQGRGFRPEVHDLILKQNAIELLGLGG
jgi:hypothetical protein